MHEGQQETFPLCNFLIFVVHLGDGILLDYIAFACFSDMSPISGSLYISP